MRLAAFDPQSSRWESAGTLAAEALVAEDPLLAAIWVDALRPVRQSLLPGLQAVFRDRDRGDSVRSLVTSILADYAGDRPELLANLLMDADEKQFAVLLPKFKDHDGQGLSILTSEVGKKLHPVITDWTVRFYQWTNAGPQKSPADWEAVLKSPILDRLRMSRLSFYGDEYEVRMSRPGFSGSRELPMGPTNKVPHNYFAVVATTEVTLEDGEYVLTTTFDDGVRVWLDNAVVLDNWGADYRATRSVRIERQRGRHTIKVEYFQIQGGYSLDLALSIRDEAKEKLANRQANAAVALLKMNHPASVWPLLKQSPDPRVRSYLIHRFAPLGVDFMALVHRLDEEPDDSIRRALILSLGEFDTTPFPGAERKAILAKLLDLYRSDPDPGLHGAADWLLRQKGWDQVNELARIDRQLHADEKRIQASMATDKRRWYVNTEGQTFVILNANQPFRMGSSDDEQVNPKKNETPHPQEIGRKFAIASKIVTKAQFRHFQRANPDAPKSDIEQYSRTDDSPQILVNWYDAARYCNWLSKNEGIPQEQWCYEPNDQARYAEGMRPAGDYLQRRGYRLPTEAEWEYACRSGSETSRYYGTSVKLLPNYAWFGDNSDDRLWPVGMKKPNDYGMFDMLGELLQWCDNIYLEDYGYLDDSGTGADVENLDYRVLRGGVFSSPAPDVRSAWRGFNVPTSRTNNIGFRVARTFP